MAYFLTQPNPESISNKTKQTYIWTKFSKDLVNKVVPRLLPVLGSNVNDNPQHIYGGHMMDI